MRTYIASFIPKYKQFSKKLDNEALLMNQHWVMVDDSTNTKTVYIFKADNRLLLSTNGKVKEAKWEMIDPSNVLVTVGDDGYLFKHGFLNEGILALNLDGSSEYALFVNENAEEVCGLRSPEELEGYLDSQDQVNSAEVNPKELNQKRKSETIKWIILVAIIVFIYWLMYQLEA